MTQLTALRLRVGYRVDTITAPAMWGCRATIRPLDTDAGTGCKIAFHPLGDDDAEMIGPTDDRRALRRALREGCAAETFWRDVERHPPTDDAPRRVVIVAKDGLGVVWWYFRLVSGSLYVTAHLEPVGEAAVEAFALLVARDPAAALAVVLDAVDAARTGALDVPPADSGPDIERRRALVRWCQTRAAAQLDGNARVAAGSR